jgi:hypothetical protein
LPIFQYVIRNYFFEKQRNLSKIIHDYKNNLSSLLISQFLQFNDGIASSHQTVFCFRVAASSNNGMHGKTSSAVFQMTFIGYPNSLLRITLVGDTACFQ